MKEILKATYSLFFFKPYTIYDRFYEVGYGILAWLSLVLIIIGLI